MGRKEAASNGSVASTCGLPPRLLISPGLIWKRKQRCLIGTLPWELIHVTSLGAPGSPSGTLFRLMPAGTGPEQNVRLCQAGRCRASVVSVIRVACRRGRADYLHQLSVDLSPAIIFLPGRVLKSCSSISWRQGWQGWLKAWEQCSGLCLMFPVILHVSVTGPKTATGIY